MTSGVGVTSGELAGGVGCIGIVGIAKLATAKNERIAKAVEENCIFDGWFVNGRSRKNMKCYMVAFGSDGFGVSWKTRFSGDEERTEIVAKGGGKKEASCIPFYECTFADSSRRKLRVYFTIGDESREC